MIETNLSVEKNGKKWKWKKMALNTAELSYKDHGYK